MHKISFLEPMGIAWERMIALLFTPLDLIKWLKIAFSAWLAYIGYNFFITIKLPITSFLNINFITNINLSTDLIIALLFSIVLLILLINSQAKFIFLDNIINKKEVCLYKPFIIYQKEGVSLFLWRLFFYLIYSVILAISVLFCTLFASFYINININIYIISLLTVFVFYISLFLEDFIVPLMLKEKIDTNSAWFIFFTIFKKHIFIFFIYGIFRFILTIIIYIFLLLIALGSFCCCCFGIVFILPYIGTVLILPARVFLRFYSLAFLAQFGKEYNLLWH